MDSYKPISCSLFPFSDGLVLHQPASRRLNVVNSTAAIIWCLLHEVESVNELINRLVSDYQISSQEATKTVSLALEQYSALGLLANTSLTPDPPPEILRYPAGDHKPLHLVKFPPLNKYIFSLCSKNILVFYPNEELLTNLREIFGHLEQTDQGEPQLEFSIVHNESGKYDLYLAGRRRAKCLSVMEIIPWLNGLIFEKLSKALTKYQLIHAGVVAQGGNAILFPGSSGCGKSTLVTAMAATGRWRYLSDELALIGEGKGTVFPYPQAASIKAGAFKPLFPYYPELKIKPEYNSLDRRMVRYLFPGSAESARDLADRAFEVSALFFPIYLPQVKTQCTRLLPFEALQRLALVGSSQRFLTASDIESLIYLADILPCYLLYFDDLEEAISMIEKQWTQISTHEL